MKIKGEERIREFGTFGLKTQLVLVSENEKVRFRNVFCINDPLMQSSATKYKCWVPAKLAYLNVAALTLKEEKEWGEKNFSGWRIMIIYYEYSRYFGIFHATEINWKQIIRSLHIFFKLLS